MSIKRISCHPQEEISDSVENIPKKNIGESMKNVKNVYGMPNKIKNVTNNTHDSTLIEVWDSGVDITPKGTFQNNNQAISSIWSQNSESNNDFNSMEPWGTPTSLKHQNVSMSLTTEQASNILAVGMPWNTSGSVQVDESMNWNGIPEDNATERAVSSMELYERHDQPPQTVYPNLKTVQIERINSQNNVMPIEDTVKHQINRSEPNTSPIRQSILQNPQAVNTFYSERFNEYNQSMNSPCSSNCYHYSDNCFNFEQVQCPPLQYNQAMLEGQPYFQPLYSIPHNCVPMQNGYCMFKAFGSTFYHRQGPFCNLYNSSYADNNVYSYAPNNLSALFFLYLRQPPTHYQMNASHSVRSQANTVPPAAYRIPTLSTPTYSHRGSQQTNYINEERFIERGPINPPRRKTQDTRSETINQQKGPWPQRPSKYQNRRPF